MIEQTHELSQRELPRAGGSAKKVRDQPQTQSLSQSSFVSLSQRFFSHDVGRKLAAKVGRVNNVRLDRGSEFDPGADESKLRQQASTERMLLPTYH